VFIHSLLHRMEVNRLLLVVNPLARLSGRGWDRNETDRTLR